MFWAFQVVLVVKNLPTNAEDVKILGFDPWVRKIPWKRARQPTPVFLPGESHEQRNLVGYSPWGRKEWESISFTGALMEISQADTDWEDNQ